ncbi:hypothetical protein [Amycolatopsis magusensis]|uniref:Uncharacterized protein n=1 Tax=Amycolatopsis magusensis TaxID=882444 RepID=A0ABS4Q8M4_9PSEU|nr:hypothetical protein [Amycolatopsis magusensis]MBP2187076.1 hypothetical protein [Amycolatopsis magusensis]
MNTTNTRRWAVALGCWILGYGAVRLFVAPPGGVRHADLSAVPAWAVAAICALGALVAFAPRVSRAVVLAGWVVAATLSALGFVLVLDLVALALPGLDLPFELRPFLLRLGCALSGLAFARLAVALRRQLRGGCPDCGRVGGVSRLAVRPRWALAAGYAAVAGCALRFGAQTLYQDQIPLEMSPSWWIFVGGMLAGGTLLPLALVHRWGEVWPRWVLPLAGRRVPRLVLLLPAALFALGLVSYFGAFGLVELLVDWISGEPVEQALFLWLAVLGYLAWGLGLGGAAIAYHARTRSGCASCAVPAPSTADRTGQPA